MKLSLLKAFAILTFMGFLSGCASEPNIPMQDQFWQAKQDKIAIAKTKTITPALYKTGNQGLLDLAINSAMTHKLDNKISESDVSWYEKLPHQFALKLQKRNKVADEVATVINDDAKNYRSFVSRVGANELLVIDLENFGAIRNYYAFIPTGAPKAFCQLTGKLIDTTTNKILWRHRATSTEEVNGPWDQPPYYPNVTKAIRVAANNAQEELLDSFFSGH